MALTKTISEDGHIQVVITTGDATSTVTLGNVEGGVFTAQFTTATGGLDASNDGTNFMTDYLASSGINAVLSKVGVPFLLRSQGDGAVVITAWQAK